MVQPSKQGIVSRIRQLREEYAGPRGRSKFANALGLSSSTYNYYENDRIPPGEILLKMCEITGADLYWLLTGVRQEQADSTGELFVDSKHHALLVRISELLDRSPSSKEPLEAFIEILEEKAVIEDGVEHRKASRFCGNCDSWIPVLGRTAAGIVHLWNDAFPESSEQAETQLAQLIAEHTGEKAEAVASEVRLKEESGKTVRAASGAEVSLVRVNEGHKGVFEFVDCPSLQKEYSDAFALHVDGDSMSPRLEDGDIVICSPSVPAEEGRMAVVKIKGQIGVTCKIIRRDGSRTHLIAVNENYGIKICDTSQMEWSLAVLNIVKL